LSSTFFQNKIRAFFNSGFTLYKKWKKCGTEMSKLNRYLEIWTYLKRQMQNVQTDGNSIVSEVSTLISLSTFDAVYLAITLSDQRRVGCTAGDVSLPSSIRRVNFGTKYVDLQ
jgi:hypothetical protein